MFELPTVSIRDGVCEQRPHPVWPLPRCEERAPIVIHDGATGIKLAYAREHESELVDLYPPGTRNGSLRHFMPDSTPVFAVSDGVVVYCGPQSYGHALVIDHLNGWATYYADLEGVVAASTSRRPPPPRQRVTTGDVIGHVGGFGPEALLALHFELWKRDDNFVYQPVPPNDEMQEWRVLPWSSEPTTPARASISDAA